MKSKLLLIMSNAIKPFDLSRVETFFRMRKLDYSNDPDGSISRIIDHHTFTFRRIGESDDLLEIVGQWRIETPIEERPRLLVACNDFSRTTSIAKPYVVLNEMGKVHVFGEFVCDFTWGATDEQLHNSIRLGCNGIEELFRTLEVIFPEYKFVPPPPPPPKPQPNHFGVWGADF